MSGLFWIEPERLKAIADERHKLHINHATSRPLSKDYEYIGLAGELAFSMEFMIPMDLERKPGGDRHVDFVTPAGTVDVKTYRHPISLLREVGKPHADILVLAGYDEITRTAKLIGWEWDAVMVKQYIGTSGGHKILNHKKPARMLRPIKELWRLFNAEQLLGQVIY